VRVFNAHQLAAKSRISQKLIKQGRHGNEIKGVEEEGLMLTTLNVNDFRKFLMWVSFAQT
jgi:uncharacterized protein YegL